MTRDSFNRWIQGPFATNWQALLCGMFAIWLPSVIRLEVNGTVTGCEFTPYLPFVLLCAILMKWWQAAAVALISVAVLGGLFAGSPFLTAACFKSAAGIFIGASAAMIVTVGLVRRFLAAMQIGADRVCGVVFSVDQGDVWASWNGLNAPVRLGSRNLISEKMERFLAEEQRGSEHRSAGDSASGDCRPD